MHISTTTFAAVLGLSSLASGASADPNTDFGKIEYESNCASCHGLSGKGDGPLSDVFRNKAPDLSTLSKRNEGVFPAQRVYEVIDGRKEVEAHGPRTMPVWGREYQSAVPDLVEWGYIDFGRSIAHARVASLVDYLFRMQKK